MTELAPNHRRQLAGAYLLAFASTGFGTLLLAPWRETIELSNIALLYVLAVVLIAISSGRGPAVAAALLSAFDFAYVFVPPHYSLAITEAQYILVAAIMLVVALAVGHLTSRLKQSVDRAERKSAVSAALCGLAQELAGAVSAASIRQCTEKFLTASLGVSQLHILPLDAVPPADLPVTPALLRECQERNAALSRPLGANLFYLLLPLRAGDTACGILGFAVASRHLEGQDDLEYLETVASIIAVALERAALAERVRDAEVRHAAESLRSSVLSALSHDLRTPLTALVGMADTLLLANASPERQQGILAAIRQQAISISGQMNNLLEMARLSSGAPQLSLAWQPIDEVLGSLLQQREQQWPGRTIRLKVAEQLPPVCIDAVLIERVLWNLLDNAIKYSPEEAAVDLGVERNGQQLEITVCDRGPGIAPEAAQQLFAMFQRGERESNRPGLGLGLSIAERIVQAHRGRLFASPRPGGGSCFTVCLPLDEAPDLSTLEG